MNVSNVCPTEDAIQVFLDLLVDPLLPKSIRETPTQDKQERVAKQVHAVVLLYNHFFRKRHPHLSYLDFESFCTLALVLKPNLKFYMNTQRTNDTQSGDLEKQLSTTEKAIKDACDISRSLGASVNVPNAKGWPVKKVAILLINQTKMSCILMNNSITEGVKSLIEKDVNESSGSSEGFIETEQTSKRKRTTNKHWQAESEGDECHFRKIAFKAVEEATKDGIKQGDLTIIKSHDVYSLSKVKTATRFYIMQCAHAAKARWIPIKDVFDSLQGPLLQNTSSRWMHTSVVEYFHLLPYSRIISQWFSSNVFPIEEPESVQEVVNVNGFEMTEEPSEPEVQNNTNIDLIDGGIVEASRNSSRAESEKLNENNEPWTNDFLDATGGTWNMDVDKHSMVQIEKSSTSKSVVRRVQYDSQLKKINSHALHDLNGTTDKPKVEVVRSPVQNLNHLKDQNGTDRKAPSSNMPVQNGIPAGTHALVIRESNSEYSTKLHEVIASKEHVLSEAALSVVLRKRDKLVLHLRDIVDEIAQYDKKMQIIMKGNFLTQEDLHKISHNLKDTNEKINEAAICIKYWSRSWSLHSKAADYKAAGGEDALELKLDLIIEGCQGDPSKDYGDPCSIQSKKRNRISEEPCSKQNPCQELDDICKDNNLLLPTYEVFPLDGGYQAKVSVRGTNLESSSVGEACPEPCEARSSAASKMLTKLLDHV